MPMSFPTQALKHARFAAALLAALALAPLPARAVTNVWSGTGANANWTTVGNWTNNATPGSADTVMFIVTNYPSTFATTLNGDKTISSLVLATSNGVTISGSTLTLGSGLLNRTTSSQSNQIINSALTLGADGVFIINGLAHYRTNLLINGSIGESGGSRSLAIAGARLLHLMGSNTFTGSLTITNTAGVVVGGTNAASSVTVGNAAGAGSLLQVAGDYALGNGTLVLNTNAFISGYGASRMVGNAVTANGNFTVGPTTVAGVGGGLGLTFTNLLTLNASLSISNALGNDNETAFFAGGIGDGGAGRSLTLNAAGAKRRLMLTNSTYTGATVINNGYLLMSGTNATSSVAVNSGATLVFLTDNPFSAGTMITASNATLTSSNSHSFSSPVTFTGTTNTHSGTGNLTFNGVVTMATSMVFMASGGNAVDGFAFASNVVETLPGSSLTLGGGTRSLLLLGSNSYSGGTYVSSTARLIIGNNKALGTGTLYAQAAAGITTLAWTNSPTVANAIQMQHTNLLSGLSIGGNQIVFNGPVTMTTNVVLNLNSTISANDDASAPVFAGGFNDNGNNFSLTVLGSNDRFLIFSNASSYGGGTFILNGLLKLGGHNALPTAGALAVNGPQDLKNGFSLSNFNQTVGSLSGTGVVQLFSGTLTVGDATDSTFSGFMNGTGFLVKQGSGTFTLGGSNAYTGGTIVSNGTLRLGVQTAILSNRAVTVAGGNYDLGGFGAVTNGTVTISSGAISNGTLLSSSNLLATDSGTIFANLAGNGGLIKTGTGTLSLNGNSSQVGATRVSNGVLRVNGVLSGTAGLTVASNATLGGTGSVRGVNIANGGWLAPGNSIGTLTVSNLTLNSGSLLNFELAATNASDQVIDLGTLTLTQMPFSNFAFTTNAGFGVGTYTLIDAALLSGSFNPVTNESFYGYLGTISLDGANNDLILNVALAIPEPSALALLALGALLALRRSRRA